MPAVIPEPVHVRHDAAPPAGATEKSDKPKHGRRNPGKTALAKVLSGLRGDTHMDDADPAARREDVRDHTTTP
ncbi:MAG: hypothetical protein M3018_01715 [Actinomycetota bacterium]|nr:hypothetical protein [Actinomycetota bacterium]